MSELNLSSSRHTWAYLNRVLEGPSPTLHGLLTQYSAEEIARGIYKGEDWIGPLRQATASRREWLRQDEDLAVAEAQGARLITPADAEWPGEEFSRAFGFYHQGVVDAPATFDDQAVPPHSLWVRGGNLREAVSQSVALVGTRAVSRYGWEAASLLAGGLAAHQWTAVSGGAVGVDTAVHEAALDAGGLTVAVAACGIDISYPARNAKLFDRIAEKGCIVSEFAPGTRPQRFRFLSRNRLVAAMTSGTVVVEAGFRSGALNTLNWAEALGRVAMAVPGPITTSGSLGGHQRIQDGRAQLVASADEVRGLVGKAGEVDVVGQYELEFQPTAVQRLSRNELRVYDSTPPESAEEGASAEDIAAAAGMRVALTIHLLVAMQKMGVITRSGAMWQRT